jgi:lipopolysaccharide/colanic/teichoic acid biosynthesis glycosyltransferase
MQRIFDILISLSIIFLLSPILLITILTLRLTGEGKIFYIQERVGRNRVPFGLIKFVTMRINSEKEGLGTITTHGDVRVLPIGRYLRKSKLNEVPQIFNILIGNMSFIGPRPLHQNQFYYYDSHDADVISSVRPGLSGVGSIFYRNEEDLLSANISNPKDFYKNFITPNKARLEKWYVKNKSISLYFKLIMLTILVVVNCEIDVEKILKINKSSSVGD